MYSTMRYGTVPYCTVRFGTVTACADYLTSYSINVKDYACILLSGRTQYVPASVRRIMVRQSCLTLSAAAPMRFPWAFNTLSG